MGFLSGRCVKSEMHIPHPNGHGKYAVGIQGKGPGREINLEVVSI